MLEHRITLLKSGLFAFPIRDTIPRMPRTVRVTSPVAGWGNQIDLDLVCLLLEQNGFDVTPWPAVDRSKKARLSSVAKRILSGRGRFDINVFLAPIFPEWIPLARKSVLIPNAEGFAQASWLKRIDLVLAKTRLTERIFQGLGCRTEFVSFTSEDHLDKSVPRDETTFFHSCSSQYKGTQRMLETWRRHPEWPLLTAVVNNNELIPPALFTGPNIRVIRERLYGDELRRLQNSHGFHLCCSEAEGFGHYIMEAMSCRALPLTSDGPPMNELVQPDRGLLVPCEDERPAMRFSKRHIIRHDGLEKQVEEAIRLDATTKRTMGEAGRAFFLENDRFFRQHFIDVMMAL